MLGSQLEREMAEQNAGQTVAARVKWILLRLLGGHSPDLGEVAKDLGMSIRTLQRRMTEEGTSFRQLLSDARREIRLLARREIVAVLRRDRRTWVHTVREEFATYYPLADLVRWLDGDPFVQIGRHAVVNLQAIEHVTHYGDRLYRVRLRDRVGTEITASRTGAARLAAVLKTQR